MGRRADRVSDSDVRDLKRPPRLRGSEAERHREALSESAVLLDVEFRFDRAAWPSEFHIRRTCRGDISHYRNERRELGAIANLTRGERQCDRY
jgi:hypothetical protein